MIEIQHEKEETKDKYEVVELGNARMILSQKIMGQIASLHSIVGKDEWSGILFYTIEEGTMYDPEKLLIKAQEMFLLDIGNATYTEYSSFGKKMLDLYDENPELEKMFFGHIHTHHSMNAYFSGTDTSELEENVSNHRFYLSLVVNFEGKYAAKLVYLADVIHKRTFSAIDQHGKKNKKQNTTKKEEAMCSIDFKFYIDSEPNSVSRVREVREEAKKKAEEKAKMRNEVSNNEINNGMFISYVDGRRIEIPTGRKVMDESVQDYHIRLKAENKLRDYIVKVIYGDISCTKDVYSTLRDLEEVEEKGLLDEALDNMYNNLMDFANIYFKRSFTQYEFEVLMKSCISIVERYKGMDIHAKVVDVFDMAIESEDVEDEKDDIEVDYNKVQKSLSNR